MRKFAAFATVILFLTACGGGGGGNQTTPSVTHSASASVTFTIQVPTKTGASLRRVPNYVSAATKSATLSVSPAGGPAGPTVAVTCTSVCQGTVSAPVGSDTFAVNLYGTTNESGPVLSTGTGTQTIVADVANSINLTFNGVVASLSQVAFAAGVAYGTSSTPGIALTVRDPAGDTIVGPGSYVDANGNPFPITLTNYDASGATALSETRVTSPSDTITMSYNGSGVVPAVSASATGMTMVSASDTVSGATVVKLATDTVRAAICAPRSRLQMRARRRP
jgi:hypothetical protein